MSYTLRGRLESRFATVLAPVLAAAVLAAVLEAWWPLEVAGLMAAVGVALDVALYHRLLRYQPGWLAVPLGALELAVVMSLAWALGVHAPPRAALAYYAGAWLLAQVLGHALFPLLRVSYGEDGGELGRAGLAAAATCVAVAAFSGGVAWGSRPPTVELPAGVHRGPLVIDEPQTLEGEPGAVVRGGIVVLADDVTIRNVTVVGGENGITVDGAEGVVIEDVEVSGAELDAINFRRSSGAVRDCRISLQGEYKQGIDVSFGFDLAPTLIERCAVEGGYEGIVSHFAHVEIRENVVTGTSLRAITVTEMSMGRVSGNVVMDALGVGIFCGDYSECVIEDNVVSGTDPDPESDDRTRDGFALLAHFGAKATISGNELSQNAHNVGAFSDGTILRR